MIVIPTGAFPLIDDKNPIAENNFLGYFRNELGQNQHDGRPRGDCKKKWKQFLSKMGWKKNEEKPSRVLQDIVATDVNMPIVKELVSKTIPQLPIASFELSPEMKELLENSSEEMKVKIHKAISMQRDLDVKKFNLFVKKERMITLMTTLKVFKKRCHGCGIWFAILFPLFAILAFKCKKRRAFMTLKRLLQVENEVYWHKRGYHWSINKKLTELTMKRREEASIQMTNVNYPNQVTEATPFEVNQPMASYNIPLYAYPQHYAPVQNADTSMVQTDRIYQ
jgi:hypothetical protein